MKTRDVSKHTKKVTKRTTPNDDLDKLRPAVTDKQLAKIISKPKTRAGQRFIDSKGPLVHEDTKTLLLLKGHRTNEKCVKLLRDLNAVRKPHALYLSSRNQTRLIEAMDKPDDFVYLAEKNNTSLFAMCSSTKKRPFRFFCGRLFNTQLLDRFEFDVISYTPHVPTKNAVAPAEGSKPLVLFQGACWDVSGELLAVKNVMADIFGGIKADKVALEGFDHCFILTAFEEHSEALQKTHLHIRADHFHIALTKAEDDSNLPKVNLTNIGPTFVLRLSRHVSDEVLLKQAMRIPDEVWKKGKKKVETNELLEAKAKVYVTQEDYSKLNLKHGH